MNLTNLPAITFEQSWQGVEWAAKQNFDATKLSEQLSNIRDPDEKIYKSLDKMHHAFYPHEVHQSVDDTRRHLATCGYDIEAVQIDRYLPWVMHRALFDAKDAGELTEERFDGIITEILKREWLLTWHWRAVLPSLRDWKANDKIKKTNYTDLSH